MVVSNATACLSQVDRHRPFRSGTTCPKLRPDRIEFCKASRGSFTSAICTRVLGKLDDGDALPIGVAGPHPNHHLNSGSVGSAD
jgi:hypothetical protein